MQEIIKSFKKNTIFTKKDLTANKKVATNFIYWQIKFNSLKKGIELKRFFSKMIGIKTIPR